MRTPIDFEAVDRRIRDGNAAIEELADYYENLTEDELEEDFSREVTHATRAPGGISVEYGIDFTYREILAVRRWASHDERDTGRLLHDLAMYAVSGGLPVPPVLARLCRVCRGIGHICDGCDTGDPCTPGAVAPACPGCAPGDLPCPGCGRPWSTVGADHRIAVVSLPVERRGQLVCHDGEYETEN